MFAKFFGYTFVDGQSLEDLIYVYDLWSQLFSYNYRPAKLYISMNYISPKQRETGEWMRPKCYIFIPKKSIIWLIIEFRGRDVGIGGDEARTLYAHIL